MKITIDLKQVPSTNGKSRLKRGPTSGALAKKTIEKVNKVNKGIVVSKKVV